MLLPEFVHPTRRTPLIREADGYRCPATGEKFPDQDGVPAFVEKGLAEHMDSERDSFMNWLKSSLRQSPRLYLFLIFLISPVLLGGLSTRKFLERFPVGSRVLNLGSGVHRPRPDIVNVDIFFYPGVNVIANGEELPFADASIDAIICENLLEHVPRPHIIVAEMLRVLKPGGQLYVVMPFIYPFHACPNDFYRWTGRGIRELLRDGEVLDVGARAGPTSGLVAQLGAWFAIAFSFGHEGLYNILSLVGLVIFCPIKVLDLVLGRFPTAMHAPGQIYAVAKKR